MFVKSCPRCGRQPKIYRAVSRKDGAKRWMVYCPNLCMVLKPNEYSVSRWCNNSTLLVVGDYDNNALYKLWNESLIGG